MQTGALRSYQVLRHQRIAAKTAHLVRPCFWELSTCSQPGKPLWRANDLTCGSGSPSASLPAPRGLAGRGDRALNNLVRVPFVGGCMSTGRSWALRGRRASTNAPVAPDMMSLSESGSSAAQRLGWVRAPRKRKVSAPLGRSQSSIPIPPLGGVRMPSAGSRRGQLCGVGIVINYQPLTSPNDVKWGTSPMRT